MAENQNTEVNQEGSEGTEVSSSTESSSTEREYSDVERRAMEQGWQPEDQYTGNGKWRSAEEFLDRGELFSKIDELNRRDKVNQATLNEMKRHLKRVRETEYNRALETLKARKEQALEDGDHRRVVEIDDQIANTKNQAGRELAAMDQPVQVPDAPSPQFVAWVNRNNWYQNDRVMRAAADAIGEELVTSGERNPTRIFEEVEKRIKKEFPQKFNNPNRQKPGAVESGTRGNSGSGKGFQLTAEETQVMNKFVKAGLMTKDEYIADIKAQRGV